MYRYDHLAFRSLEKAKTIKFFKEALGYVEQAEFEIYFDEEKKDVALCTALQPGDRKQIGLPWTIMAPFGTIEQEYVLSPEIFVSEGTEGSIVHNWCLKHGGSGIHHTALQIPLGTTVEDEMKKWLANGWCEGFSSEVLKCDGLSQVFTKPSLATGIIWELIERTSVGFCSSSIKNLMIATKND